MILVCMYFLILLTQINLGFADNFEDFWSYGILEYCRTSMIDDKDVIKCIVELKIGENIWELDAGSFVIFQFCINIQFFRRSL